MFKTKIVFLLVGLLLLVVPVQSVHAYLDPGLGSYIWQLLIAFMIGASFVFSNLFQRVKLFFKNLFSSKKDKKNN